MHATSSCSTRKVLATRSSSVWAVGKPTGRESTGVSGRDTPYTHALGDTVQRETGALYRESHVNLAESNVSPDLRFPVEKKQTHLIPFVSCNHELAIWSSGMIRAQGARGPGLNPGTALVVLSTHIRCLFQHTVILRTPRALLAEAISCGSKVHCDIIAERDTM